MPAGSCDKVIIKTVNAQNCELVKNMCLTIKLSFAENELFPEDAL
jgi:hypothetical protein